MQATSGALAWSLLTEMNRLKEDEQPTIEATWTGYYGRQGQTLEELFRVKALGKDSRYERPLPFKAFVKRFRSGLISAVKFGLLWAATATLVKLIVILATMRSDQAAGAWPLPIVLTLAMLLSFAIMTPAIGALVAMYPEGALKPRFRCFLTLLRSNWVSFLGFAGLLSVARLVTSLIDGHSILATALNVICILEFAIVFWLIMYVRVPKQSFVTSKTGQIASD